MELELEYEEKEDINEINSIEEFNDINNANEKFVQFEKIDGIVTKIIFQSVDDGYCVCELEIDSKTNIEHKDFIVVCGTIPKVVEGERIEAQGEYVNHDRYGRQFKAETCKKKMPETEEGILKYLQSNLIKGIGDVTAKKIVEHYGAESLNVLENHPGWVAENIRGISIEKANEIADYLKSSGEEKKVLAYCANYFSPAISVKILKTYGTNAIDIIKNNPYRLYNDIEGVGFAIADNFALKLGIPKDSYERIYAGLKYILNYNAISNGHIFLPYNKLIPAAAGILKLEKELVTQTFMKAIKAEMLKAVKFYNNDIIAIYERKTLIDELYCVKKLLEINSYDININTSKFQINQYIDAIEQAQTQKQDGKKFEYTEEQRDAVLKAVENNVFVLTGGPGTGKTTVIRAIIRVLQLLGFGIALAAPTGRAAKRMQEQASSENNKMEATTIHRLLEIDYENSSDSKFGFKKNEDEPLEAGAIIIDETSMLDLSLLKSLLRAVKRSSKLIFIGDAAQLPSVRAGDVLRDMIKSKVFVTVELTKGQRQGEESLIVTNAHNINKGIMPILDVKEEQKGFFFMKRTSPETIALTIADLCKNRLPKKYGENIIDSLQILTPTKKGICGTVELNKLLQKEINPADYGKGEKNFGLRIFRVGDKVMQIKNNYEKKWKKIYKNELIEEDEKCKGVFNGDVGKIVEVDTQNEFLVVSFEDGESNNLTNYRFNELDELVHAYAITVHKSQGSEYSTVIMPISREVTVMQTRNLLYTAVTRAKQRIILIGEEETIYKMVNNNSQMKRYTGLAHMLRNEFENYDFNLEEDDNNL